MSSFQLVLEGTSDPHTFRAFVPAGDAIDGEIRHLAEHTFDWRTNSLAVARTLRQLEIAAISGRPPEDNAHVQFGQQLFSTVFSGPVGELWKHRQEELSRMSPPAVLHVTLRPDPITARPLLNLPWEYLHDGTQFVALDRGTPLTRLPWRLSPIATQPLAESLRMLVVISAPHGLDQNHILNTRLEEDLILTALADARRAGLIQVEFAPNSSPNKLATYLDEIDPHILHFVGHGSFDPTRDSGLLLLEDAKGNELHISNQEFAELVQRHKRSLRFVFLSACQSAVNSRNDAYADLAPRLLQAGVPAVVAMQFSVLNQSAMQFGSHFYKEAAKGKPLDEAITGARDLLARTSPNLVDFATPVLYASDVNCLRVDEERLNEHKARLRNALFDRTGLSHPQRFVGRNAELRLLQTGLDPQHGSWRAAIIYGLGGMGKTVLADRLADRMLPRFDGVKSIRMTPATTAQSILDQLSAFFLRLRTRIIDPNISQLIEELAEFKNQPLPLETKASIVIDLLTSLRIFVILDNYEDVLPNASLVSLTIADEAAQANQAEAELDPAQHAEREPGVDPELSRLITLFLEGVSGPSRFLITSRFDFQPLKAGSLTGAIEHLSLAELPFRDAVYLMDTLEPLKDIPIAVIPEIKFGIPTRAHAALLARGRPHTKKSLYEKLGGHPYTLTLLAEHVARSSLDNVLHDLEGLHKDLINFTLLDRAAGALEPRAGELIRRAAIYDEAVSMQGLAYLLRGDQEYETQDERYENGTQTSDHSVERREIARMPNIQVEVRSLLSWGLLTSSPAAQGEERLYAVPTPVRAWALSGTTSQARQQLWTMAAGYWLAVAEDTTQVEDYLRARHYLFLARDYDAAADIVNSVNTLLRRWGYFELLLTMLEESIGTASEIRLAAALGNKAIVYREFGLYKQAQEAHIQALELFKELGDRTGEAIVLHGLGMLHQDQAEYEPAMQMYQQALAIEQQLGDLGLSASTLGQLGILHRDLGEYEQASELYQQALVIDQELGNRGGEAQDLHGLGMIHYLHGEYQAARELHQQALAIQQELGDRSGVAYSLSQLGMIHYVQGEYEQATLMYQQALVIHQQLGGRKGVATTLQQLGMLHQKQREYEAAKELYQQALAIEQELGDRSGVAASLHQLGRLHQDQGEYVAAKELYQQALAIEQELGDRSGVAGALGQLGVIHFMQGEYVAAKELYQQALAIQQELGERRGIAVVLHFLGMLHQDQREYVAAKELYQQALAIQQELGDRSGVAATLHRLGVLYYAQGEYAEANELYQQALAIHRELGDRLGIAGVLGQLGILYHSQGAYEQARALYQQSFAIEKDLGNRSDLHRIMHHLGRLHYEQGEDEQARQMFEEAFEIELQLGERDGMAATLRQLALLCDKEGKSKEAVMLMAHAFDLFSQVGMPERHDARRDLARFREQMGEEAFNEALREVLEREPDEGQAEEQLRGDA